MFIVLAGDFFPYARDSTNGLMTTPEHIQVKVATSPQFRPNLAQMSNQEERKWAKKLCVRCWDNNPAKRPFLRVIVKMLEAQSVILLMAEQEQGLVVYIVRTGEAHEDAEDLLLSERTIGSLRFLVEENFVGLGKKKILLDGKTEIGTNEEVQRLQNECLLVLSNENAIMKGQKKLLMPPRGRPLPAVPQEQSTEEKPQEELQEMLERMKKEHVTELNAKEEVWRRKEADLLRQIKTLREEIETRKSQKPEEMEVLKVPEEQQLLILQKSGKESLEGQKMKKKKIEM